MKFKISSSGFLFFLEIIIPLLETLFIYLIDFENKTFGSIITGMIFHIQMILNDTFILLLKWILSFEPKNERIECIQWNGPFLFHSIITSKLFNLANVSSSGTKFSSSSSLRNLIQLNIPFHSNINSNNVKEIRLVMYIGEKFLFHSTANWSDYGLIIMASLAQWTSLDPDL